MQPPVNVKWTFDFISPFAYLQHAQLHELPDHFDITPVPVLFAALLKHYGNLGPAEIPPKRRHTYRYCQWYADRHGIAFKMPDAHPFNPISALRLCLATGNDRAAIARIFRFIFHEGHRTDDPLAIGQLCGELGVSETALQAPDIKLALRENTDAAAQAGIFGVPTISIGDEHFWGLDATAMCVDYARDEERFESAAMQHASNVPTGVERPR